MERKIERSENGERLQTITVKVKVPVISGKELDKILVRGSWLKESALRCKIDAAVSKQMPDIWKQAEEKAFPKSALRILRAEESQKAAEEMLRPIPDYLD